MKEIRITCETSKSIPLEEIVPFQGDFKTLSKQDFEKLKQSIIKYGLSFPSFIWKQNGKSYCLDGHQRIRVLNEMRKEGWQIPRIPIIAVEAKNEKEAKEKILLLSSQYGKYTEESLYEFMNLSGLDVSDLETFVDLPQIDFDHFKKNFYESPAEEGLEPQFDKAEELRKKYGVELGQIWELGEHRLMCGDGIDQKNLFRLINTSIDLLVTSPPYNQKIDQFKPSGMHKEGNWITKVERLAYQDSLPETTYQEQQKQALTLWYDLLKNEASCFYNHKNRYREKSLLSPLSWLPGPFTLRQEIVWSRTGSVTQNARMFLPSDERVYWMYKGSDFYFDDSTEIKSWSTVWEIAFETNKNHPVGFPIELPRRCILACSNTDANILDPYLGSGTTLIACEQLNRHCFGMEISPAYVAVAIQRWVDLTGKEPKLLK